MKKILTLLSIIVLFAPANVIAAGVPSNLSLQAAINLALSNSLELKTIEQEYISASNSLEQAEDLKDSYLISSQVDKVRYEYFLITEGYYVELAKANLEIARNKEKQFEIKTTAEVTQKFYSILLAQKNISLVNDSLKYEETKLSNIKEKYKVGMVTKLEVLQQELAVSNAKSEIELAKNNLDLAKKSLNMAVNADLTSDYSLIDPAMKMELNVATPIEIMANANNKNANVIGARANLKANRIKEIVTRRVYHGISTEYEIAAAEHEKAKIAKEQAEIGNILSVYSAYSNLLNSNAKLETAAKTVEVSKAALDSATASYNAGMITIEVLNAAEKANFQAKLGFESAKSDFSINKANYLALY